MLNKNILITGGTGSFDRSLQKCVIKIKQKKIIIYSRDELKQFEMDNKFKKFKDYKCLRFF